MPSAKCKNVSVVWWTTFQCPWLKSAAFLDELWTQIGSLTFFWCSACSAGEHAQKYAGWGGVVNSDFAGPSELVPDLCSANWKRPGDMSYSFCTLQPWLHRFLDFLLLPLQPRGVFLFYLVYLIADNNHFVGGTVRTHAVPIPEIPPLWSSSLARGSLGQRDAAPRDILWILWLDAGLISYCSDLGASYQFIISSSLL